MNANKLKIWHVGNWCIHIGQKYIESPFEAPSKDVEILNYAKPFVNALRKIPDTKIITEPSWELYHMSPEEFDERLQWADTIIFGDVETKCLMLHPDFFNRAKWEEEYVTFPDRFDLLRDWIAKGGHFHMNGGWLSFSGELGKGGWGRSRFKDVLPVDCLQHDDLIESTAGFNMRRKLPEHPSIKNINWSTVPPVLGFNETVLKKNARLIMEIENRGLWYPLLAEHSFEKGRVSCWTTGVSPHWGINFMRWESYQQFWKQLFLIVD